jgi:hypothetical protein
MASGLTQIANIDWYAPWLQAWREVGAPLSLEVAQGLPVFQACSQARKALQASKSQPVCPVNFVAQSELPEGQAYEQFIHETQSVPTRDGLHDFFNALCWLHFPLAKKQLNLVQATAIQAQGVGAVRGPVRDAVTVFDENACLIQLPDLIWDALQARQWYAAFVTYRSVWQEAQIQIFGHAALEKLVNPYKAITVHLWRVPQGVPRDQWDDWLAQDLQPAKLAQKPFLPTPVLGIPNWWPDNQNSDFYQDDQVFRPPKTATATV